MYCQICERKGFRKRFAKYNIIGKIDPRLDWKLEVCGLHARKFRSQNGKYTLETAFIDRLREAIVPVTIAGILASIVSGRAPVAEEVEEVDSAE